ncbi:MAG: alpha/beta fold hydrolase [Pseudomonadota bacterium]
MATTITTTPSKPHKVEFTGTNGDTLAARLDLPAGPVRAYALFAHCFTCSKDIFAAKRISAELAQRGLAVLRFDFTGLGASEGEFANTNFSSNVADLKAAAQWLEDNHQAPAVLVGHSLGGAAVLTAAPDLPSVKAVVTIGAPAEADHVTHLFNDALADIEAHGETIATIGGRPFRVQRQLLEDLAGARVIDAVKRIKAAVLVMHSPVDTTVGINNATDIFTAARHPKSFVSLDDADHLVSDHGDAAYAGEVIAAWASRFLPTIEDDVHHHKGSVVVAETGQGKFQNLVHAGPFHIFADEPESVGGLNSGPAPYDFLSIALGACTSMTLRMYADFKKLDLGRVSVAVDHGKVHAHDCADCAEDIREKTGKVDRFERRISVEGLDPANDPELAAKIAEIADKCPVHRTIEKGAAVVTKVEQGE